MGNFSRNTFDPVKDYVAVRLQQGIPVLDADWNELNDVTRHELYDGFALTFTDGIQWKSPDLRLRAIDPPTNDFEVEAGTALVQGRTVHVRQILRYSTQPWTDPKRAAHDGVEVIPSLTIPRAADRTDMVFLDVWEREVGNAEDGNLINPAIGIETCVRLKREAAVRVAEGETSLPPASAGHSFMPLGLLRRQARRPIEDLEHRLEDRRPLLHSPRGSRVASFFPAFLPVLSAGSESPAWKISLMAVFEPPFPAPFFVHKFHAVKSLNAAAIGVLPLILPDGAFLTHLNIRGSISHTNGELHWQLLRIRHLAFENDVDLKLFDVLHEDKIRSREGVHVFDTKYTLPSIDPTKLIVDNSLYYYALYAAASKEGYGVGIHGISIPYRYGGQTMPVDQPGASQQTVTVPQGNNSIVVRLQGHTWVSVSTDTQQLVRNQSPDPVIAFCLAPGTYVVHTDGQIEGVTTENFRQVPSLFEQLGRGTPALLTLTSDAPDRHAVDGISEVVADGTSYCTITVQKMDLNGAAVSGSEHEDELFLRTTGGVIMDDKRRRRIRSLKLRSGRAAFRLVSESSPKIATVSVLSRDPLLSKAKIKVEFV